MNKVNVGKAELRKAVETNKAGHRSEFEKAMEGFRKRAIEELDRKIADLKAGRYRISLYVSLPEPQDHTKDYDRILLMIDMHNGDEIEISQGDFAKYVMDDWEWKEQFRATNTMYTG